MLKIRNLRVGILSLLWLADWHSPVGAKPVVFWYSQPIQPGQTALVSGADLATCRNVSVKPVGFKGPSDGALPALDVKPAQVSLHSVKFTLPESLPKGAYEATLQTGHGDVTVVLNRADPYWLQGDGGAYATPGGTLRLFGTCLTDGREDPTVTMKRDDRTTVMPVITASPYSVTVRVPTDASEGHYEVTVSPLHRESAESSRPLMFDVRKPPAVPTRTVTLAPIDVSANATPDDTPQLRDALKSLSQGGGIVRLGAGEFHLFGTVQIPVGVSLVGAGRGKTILHWLDPTPAHTKLQGKHDFSVEHLSIEAASYQCGIVSDLTQPLIGHVHIIDIDMLRVGQATMPLANYYNDLPLNTHEVNILNADALELAGEDVVVADCHIDASARSMFLLDTTDSWIHDNKFATNSEGWFCITAPDRLVFERNEIIGSTPRAHGSEINTLSYSSCSQNVYLADNHLAHFHGGDGEGITTDGTGGSYIGTIDAAKGATVTLSDDPTPGRTPLVGCGVFVLNGKAQGEMRQIADVSGRIISSKQDWDPAPEPGDLVTIVSLQRNYLIIGNHVEDTGDAIQFYGSSYNSVVADNICVDAGPASNSGRIYQGGVQPSWYIQWLNNRFSGRQTSWRPSPASPGFAVYAAPSTQDPPGALCIGTVVRGNVLCDDTKVKVFVAGSARLPDYPYVQDVVIEDNSLPNAASDIQILQRTVGVFLRSNTSQTGSLKANLQTEPTL